MNYRRAFQFVIIVVIAFGALPYFLNKDTLAQTAELNSQSDTTTPRGIAEYVPITNPDTINHGSIIIFNTNGYQVASAEYDESIVGVASRTPGIAVSLVGNQDTIPLITSGTADVLVFGPIAIGDYITSSNTSGVGKKADKPGQVIGRALANVEASETPSLVPVSVDVNFVWPDGATVAFGALLANPGQSIAALPAPLRYIASGIVVLLSLIAGYWIFSRVASSTVAALGRNPLAKRSIYLLAGFQTAITLVLVVAGIVFGYLILTV